MKAFKVFQSSEAQLGINRHEGELSLCAGEEQWAGKEAMEAKKKNINHRKEELRKIGLVYREYETYQLSLVPGFPCAILNLLPLLMMFLRFLKQDYIF